MTHSEPSSTSNACTRLSHLGLDCALRSSRREHTLLLQTATFQESR
jgi:hypothetical protein